MDLDLLTQHRRRLDILLQQQARLGDYAPPYIRLEIEDAQAAIHDLKEALRAAGATVQDEPNDEAPVPISAAAARLSPIELRNRAATLQNVRAKWIRGLLEQSFTVETRIALDLEERPDAVYAPLDVQVQELRRPRRMLPGSTPIADVFDASGGELLILGAPGAGKTIILLELARDLLDRAARDLHHPIPVVFNLSSWATQHPPLATWLVNELNRIYDVPRRVAQAWVGNDALMLLLDGLDEVDPAYRAACVEAINTFRKDHGIVSLVVCSRAADYEQLNMKLKLQGAILIQPLTPQQIDTYLARAGQQLAALRGALELDAGLRELAESPLMLSIMTVAYQDLPTTALPAAPSVEAWRNDLFDTYVRRMLERRSADTRYTSRQTYAWLAYLAQMMLRHAQSIFLIEGMQPTWLRTNAQQWLYVLGIGLGGGLVGAVTGGVGGAIGFGLAGGLVNGWARVLVVAFGFGLDFAIGAGAMLEGPNFGPAQELVYRLFWGLFWGLAWGLQTWLELRRNRSGLGAAHIRLVDQLTMSWPRVLQGLGWGVGAVLLALIVIPNATLLMILWVAVLFNNTALRIRLSLLVLIGGLVGGLVMGLRSHDREEPAAPAEGIRRLVQPAIGVGLIVGLGAGLAAGLALFQGITDGLTRAARIAVLLAAGVVGGLAAGIGIGLAGGRPGWMRFWRQRRRHAGMGTRRRRLIERLGWSRSRALQGLVGGIGFGLAAWFGVALIGILLSEEFARVVREPLMGILLKAVLILGLWAGLVVGLIRGLNIREIDERTAPNQGIRRSAKNALGVMVFVAVIVGLTSRLAWGVWIAGLRSGLTYGLPELQILRLTVEQFTGTFTGVESGLTFGLAIGVGFGGFACIQHVILRTILHRYGYVPWNYARFLDYCAERILLRKLGGEYVFVHRLMMEYFASREKRSLPS